MIVKARRILCLAILSALPGSDCFSTRAKAFGGATGKDLAAFRAAVPPTKGL